MGHDGMQSRIAKVLTEARQAALTQDAYPFLPDIIKALEAMQCGLSLARERRERMAGAVGRLVTDGLDFAESPLGSSILKVADDFAIG
jgi:hypothetical protein